MRRPTALAALTAATLALLGAAPLAPASAGPTAAPVVHVTQTTDDLADALTDKPDVALGPKGAADVSIDGGVAFQKVDGFGAAFTDTSTYLLSRLPQGKRDEVMKTLFSRADGGIGLSFMRVPMGASDFTATPADAPEPYSYDDNDGKPDPALSHFSIAHDEAYTIPVLKQAQALNPQMKLFANNWSPPAWMKNNQTMLGTGDNTLRGDSYDALAGYYVKFLQAYEAAGVDVWAVTPQNEPTISPTTYPSMLFPAPDEARFIRDHLAPALSRAGLSTTIMGGDTDGVWVDYFKDLLADPATRSKVGALGAHCYANNLRNFGSADGEDLRTLFPDIPRYETECSTGPTGIAPQNAAMTTLESIYNGVSGVQLWNLALDPSGGPKIGQGCDGCTGLVTIDPARGTAEPTENFYQLGQFSRFVRPGAVRVASTDDGGDWAQAFRNADGSEALVVHNTTDDARPLDVGWDDRGSFSYTVPAHATVTFWTDPAATAPVLTADDPPTTGDVGDEYAYRFEATGTPAPTFGVAGDLPPGTTLDPKTGRLSGTLTAAGSFAFAVTADNGSGAPTVGVRHTVTVGAGPVVVRRTLSSAAAPVDGWYRGTVRVRLSGATAGQRIQYRVDDRAWRTYTGRFSISAGGTHTVQDRLVGPDGAVVARSTGSFTVKIDRTAPVVVATRDPGRTGTPRNPVTVRFDASDPASGVRWVRYRTGRRWTQVANGTPVTFDTVGRHVVRYQARDAVGRTSKVKTVRVVIGKDPATTVTAKAATVRAGGFATFSLRGYHRYSAVSLRLGSTPIGSTTTDVRGSGSVTLQVPSGTAAGSYVVTAAEAGGGPTSRTTVRVP